MLYAFYVKPLSHHRTWLFIVSAADRAWVESYAASHYDGWCKRVEELAS